MGACPGICHKCRIHRWILEHKILFQTIGYGRTGKLAFIVRFPLSNTTCGRSADVSITSIIHEVIHIHNNDQRKALVDSPFVVGPW